MANPMIDLAEYFSAKYHKKSKRSEIQIAEVIGETAHNRTANFLFYHVPTNSFNNVKPGQFRPFCRNNNLNWNSIYTRYSMFPNTDVNCFDLDFNAQGNHNKLNPVLPDWILVAKNKTKVVQ